MRWHKLDCTNLNGLIEAELDKAILRLPDNTQTSNMQNIFRGLMVRSCMRVNMIERHYNKMTATMVAERLA